MPVLTISWDLTEAEALLLQQLVDTNNAEALEAHLLASTAAAKEDPPRDVGPRPVPETLESFVARLGLKAIRGTLATMKAAVRDANISAVLKAYDNPAVPTVNKSAAIEQLGLRFDGLRLVPKA